MADKAQEYEQYGPQTAGRLFSNAMFGFNKEEVLEYLEELADENTQRQESAQQRIAELGQQAEELEMRVQQAQEEVERFPVESGIPDGRVEELSASLEATRSAAAQAEEELQEFKEQLFNSQKENNWLREEYQKSDKQIAELRRQLDDASHGQWYGADEQITELRRQLEEVLAERDAAEAERDAAEAERDYIRVERDNIESECDNLSLERDNLSAEREAWEAERESYGDYEAEETESHPMGQAAATIIAEATEEAERIRADAYSERERVHRQVLSGAGGLSTSISTLREEISGVEGDVTNVLETVQSTLAELMVSLGRTEQNLATLGTQAERFPSSSPLVTKSQQQQQVVYFQPGEQIERRQSDRRQSDRRLVAPPQSYGKGGFHPVVPQGDTSKPRTFQPTFVTSGQTAYQPQAAPDISPQYEAEEDEDRMRNLTDTLVDTLRQMMQ